MARYIDADALKTVKSIQMGNFNSIETIQEWIDNAPTADVKPVVRCKDCRWWVEEHGNMRCECHNADPYEMPATDSEDFCSFGERRTDE